MNSLKINTETNQLINPPELNSEKQNSRNDRNKLNYASILTDKNSFRSSGTRKGSKFNLYDTPGQKYFKLLFYFINGDSENNYNIQSSSGLLTPVWQIEYTDYRELYNYNSAWSYLTINNETERADQLKSFVSLLSNINSESPWYFKELTGLDAALERKSIGNREFKFDEERQKISIKCEIDSVDDRIGTLLDLYRSVVWSNITKQEILPANLRKFDMGVYVFETPTVPIHRFKSENAKLINISKESKRNQYQYAAMDGGSSHQTSYKYIELHNCEIDYNSSKTPYATLNNADGTQMEYTIDIYFDDCYEKRFNEFEMRNIGDMIFENLNIETKDLNITDSFANYYEKGFLENAFNEGISFAKGKASGFLKHIYLGNLFGLSLSNAKDFGEKLSQGQIIQSSKVIKKKIEAHNNKKHHVRDLGNLFKSKTIANNI